MPLTRAYNGDYVLVEDVKKHERVSHAKQNKSDNDSDSDDNDVYNCKHCYVSECNNGDNYCKDRQNYVMTWLTKNQE